MKLYKSPDIEAAYKVKWGTIEQRVLAAQRPAGTFHVEWMCEYPEFGDLGCIEEHDATKTPLPRKHQACGFHLVSDATIQEGELNI